MAQVLPLPFDVVLRVLEALTEDAPLGILYSCTLVDRQFNNAASKLLYKRVVLSPPFTRTINLKQRSQELTGQFISACLPHNSSFVLELVISEYLLDRASPMNSFPQTLRSAIEQWINLNSITLHPRSYPSDLLTVALPQFLHCAHLKTLSVDRACYDGEGSTLLSHISGLETLILYGTNRAILQLLPDWLDRLKKTLRIFALRNGCGSVTPGVLRSLLPPLVGIRHLELGLSYSLTNDDLFSSLNELPSLQHLELHYYIQLRTPTIQVCLPALKSFTVYHQRIATRKEFGYFIRWTRSIITNSLIEKLVVMPDSHFWMGAPVSFDGLITHLQSKHHETLRVIRMDVAYVRQRTLRKMVEECHKLEEIGIGVHANVLSQIPEFFNPCPHLHTMVIYAVMLRPSRVNMNIEKARHFMCGGSYQLHRLSVNKLNFKGSWTTESSGKVRFAVRDVGFKTPRRPPNPNVDWR